MLIGLYSQLHNVVMVAWPINPWRQHPTAAKKLPFLWLLDIGSIPSFCTDANLEYFNPKSAFRGIIGQ